jgi:hypothetical protein
MRTGSRWAIATVLMLLAVAGQAQPRWVVATVAGTVEASYVFFYDADSVRVIGKYVRAWIRTEYPEKEVSKMRSSITLVEFECEEERNRDLSFIAYREPGLKGAPHVTDKSPSEWTYPPPGTTMGIVMKEVCRLGRK